MRKERLDLGLDVAGTVDTSKGTYLDVCMASKFTSASANVSATARLRMYLLKTEGTVAGPILHWHGYLVFYVIENMTLHDTT